MGIGPIIAFAVVVIAIIVAAVGCAWHDIDQRQQEKKARVVEPQRAPAK